ncbi:MAG TPA: aminoglycoside phosphotransferase family protein, partial [Chitinophagaceae bacterium]
PVTAGLINQTYKVIIRDNGYKFLLQQINRDVFPAPEKVQANYEKIWSYMYDEGPPPDISNPLLIPKPLNFLDDTKLFCDSHNRYWRKFEFIDGAQTFYNATNSIQARTVANVFGSITASFEFFDLNKLYITIPGFHDLSLRFRQFKQSLHKKNYERLQKAASIINQLKEKEHYASFYEVITASEEFGKRLMHHDAKISNILFSEETGQVICPVDFDTCMPGYFFSDLGDMIRSMACSEGENSSNYNEINIRKDFYESILDGYIEVMHELLTDSEKKYIHYSGLFMIYMQALRFLSDYLNEDNYYRTTYPEQNFVRAKNQLTLLQRLEEFLSVHYQFKI